MVGFVELGPDEVAHGEHGEWVRDIGEVHWGAEER